MPAIIIRFLLLLDSDNSAVEKQAGCRLLFCFNGEQESQLTTVYSSSDLHLAQWLHLLFRFKKWLESLLRNPIDEQNKKKDSQYHSGRRTSRRRLPYRHVSSRKKRKLEKIHSQQPVASSYFFLGARSYSIMLNFLSFTGQLMS